MYECMTKNVIVNVDDRKDESERYVGIMMQWEMSHRIAMKM